MCDRGRGGFWTEQSGRPAPSSCGTGYLVRV